MDKVERKESEALPIMCFMQIFLLHQNAFLPTRCDVLAMCG